MMHKPFVEKTDLQSPLLKTLHKRGLLKNCTDIEELDKRLINHNNSFESNNADAFTFYIGFDLTAEGLHIGNLATLLIARWILKYGHKVVILLGGGTTYIGDASGKDDIRPMLNPEQIEKNKEGICLDILSILRDNVEDDTYNLNTFVATEEEKYISRIVAKINLESECVFREKNVTIVDNFHWLSKLNYIDFLRDIGKHFTVNKLIKLDAVRTRLERERPFSFLEFNYPLLQAYDFMYMNSNYDVSCQIGGSDQWGNIVAGVDLIHHISNGTKVFGLTVPLITRSDGKKMGKSEDGAIWIKGTTSNKSYGTVGTNEKELFQYFRNVDDVDVECFLKTFTMLEGNELKTLLKDENINHQKERLAFEVTKICRGEDIAQQTLVAMQKLFVDCNYDENVHGKPFILNINSGSIIMLLVECGVVSSNSEARRILEQGGVSVNGKKITTEQDAINVGKSVMNKTVLLRVGKKNRFWILFTE